MKLLIIAFRLPFGIVATILLVLYLVLLSAFCLGCLLLWLLLETLLIVVCFPIAALLWGERELRTSWMWNYPNALWTARSEHGLLTFVESSWSGAFSAENSADSSIKAIWNWVADFPADEALRLAGRCLTCSGTGKCAGCEGAGRVVQEGFFWNSQEPCQDCNSSGSCTDCAGSGSAASGQSAPQS